MNDGLHRLVVIPVCSANVLTTLDLLLDYLHLSELSPILSYYFVPHLTRQW
jgi:hypothetical protein